MLLNFLTHKFRVVELFFMKLVVEERSRQWNSSKPDTIQLRPAILSFIAISEVSLTEGLLCLLCLRRKYNCNSTML